MKSTSTDRIPLVDPSSEQIFDSVPDCSAADVARAVDAAARAFPAWSSRPVDDRVKYVLRAKNAIEDRADDFADAISLEMGAPWSNVRNGQVAMTAMDIDASIRAASAMCLEEDFGGAIVRHEPIGVVGCITPWNVPLKQAMLKIAPALLAGCPVVLKPSELAPSTGYLLAEVFEELGLPDGVFNMVTGRGLTAGRALAQEPRVDMISFTGSTRGGRQVTVAAAGTIKKVVLELGGKSPNIVLPDADLDAVIPSALGFAFANSGQVCTALSRLIVPRDMLKAAERAILDLLPSFVVGHPRAADTRLGPLVSRQQQVRVHGYIRSGVEQGARILAGGENPVEGHERGYYVAPTVFSDVTADMTIAQEEIFGPVLSVMPYADEDDAVKIANGTRYGLFASVWSADLDRARQVAKRLRCGGVLVNGARAGGLGTPFGGVKQSGLGREGGRFGLMEYFEPKTIFS